MLTRIYIDNYRCFSNFDFVPAQCNLLLGDNGAGKSSLLDAIDAIVDVCGVGVPVFDGFPTRSRTRWDSRDSQRFELTARIGTTVFTHELVITHDVPTESPSITLERVRAGDRTLFAYEQEYVQLFRDDGSAGARFPFGGMRSFLPDIDLRAETALLFRYVEFLAHCPVIRLDARRIPAQAPSETRTLNTDGTNFAEWYRHIQQENPSGILMTTSELGTALPGFVGLRLPASVAAPRTRELRAVFMTSGRTYDLAFDELSDGQRALIVLYHLPAGIDLSASALFLDEPEAHVGLAAVQPWLRWMEDRLGASGQLFISSHHPEVINALASRTPWLLDRPDGGPSRIRPAEFDRESGLLASEQIARGMLSD